MAIERLTMHVYYAKYDSETMNMTRSTWRRMLDDNEKL